MRQAAFGLVGSAALDREHAVESAFAENGDHPGPVDDAVAAGAAHRRAGHFAALGFGVLDGDVLGVHVDQQVAHRLQSLVGVFAAQVGVAGVVVDAEAGRDPPEWRCAAGPGWCGRCSGAARCRCRCRSARRCAGPRSGCTS